MIGRGPIVLAAGGTGGHVFPAQALAEILTARGWRIALVTDSRGTAFGESVAGVETHRIRAASFSGGILTKLKGLIQLGLGLIQARNLLRRLSPSAAVGFGGYPSVPTMWAATGIRLPTLIHEQNAVLGRANRLLAPRVDRIATSFEEIQGIQPKDRQKVVLTGNPVRAAITAIASQPYPQRQNADDPLNLLIFGGSQGATILSDVVPAAIAALTDKARQQLRVVQQCRAEDLDRVRKVYSDAGIQAELAPFFDDMPARLAATHLVVARAGASTIAEVTSAGRPVLLVPYRHAMDDHQTANARAIEEAGGGWMLSEDDFTPSTLKDRLQAFLATPDLLTRAAAGAHNAGRTDAADSLADAAEALAAQGEGTP
ncbi:MAG: undecaprenyldiphospho-muramoylpentapeptide beta-N-acetylglucosaminyltransferase [Rhodospirillaceae bacterium]|jgi:UDP-N-acetylglucosamine--N-acetylmuramyl-(pentapeptide) pyrophosphoryl-undecaprenol N-acetylglucosamine transferase|nr:undecaprenyldiphospho-muramoylpentapeptide beta-N-acetylglucosaminyltransferase [Rhodospirillaceae bacterium]MBT5455104.1 undecaprenyldiphospho-muramoylpentapeptide beta-N-acetylglucosaminyltransferase [Rhodospirillaceae bacterium]